MNAPTNTDALLAQLPDTAVKPRRARAKARAKAPAPKLPKLSRQQVDEIQAAFDRIRDEVVADLGQRDADYIRGIVRKARGSAIAGRAALMFGIDPLSWMFGVGALAYAKILENMEIGHNVMHGQYDWMKDPSLDSSTYDWDNVCAAENWKHFHNFEHHTYTNVIGKDRDFGYTVLRLSDEQPWEPRYLGQPLWNLALAFMFQWGVGVHDQQIDQWWKGKLSAKALHQRMKPFYKKAAKQLFKDYMFFPALALWNAPRVFAGNLAANMIRNLWAYAIIFCGHFTADVQVFSEEQMEGETRGDWYVRQILGSSNLEGSKFFYLLTGHLSHQIEHHLFPDLPAHRYPAIAEQVRAICKQYGIPYNNGSFAKQYGEVLKRVFVYMLPAQTRAALRPA